MTTTFTEIDLLNLARSAGQEIDGNLGQIITITFAMVVAIFYFLHQAGIRMKVFAFLTYTFGMFTYFGMMLMESSVALGAIKALQAVPREAQSLPTLLFLGIRSSWVGTIFQTLLNLVFWVLWLGVGYLLFFWRKPREVEERSSRTRHP